MSKTSVLSRNGNKNYENLFKFIKTEGAELLVPS